MSENNTSLYLRLIKEYNIEYYFYVLLTQNTGINNPYHNNFHTITVLVNSYKISKLEGLSKEQTRPILIAAIFHDFNHSGGVKEDSENINVAISAFKNYSKESNEDNKLIIEIISATQYPYVSKIEDLTIEQKIICDADLTQFYADNYLQQIIYGLLMSEQKMDLKKALDVQQHFLDRVQPLTKYGNQLYDKFMQKRMHDNSTLFDLIKYYG